MAPKDLKDENKGNGSAAAVASPEPAATPPQTKEEIAATEQAMGLAAPPPAAKTESAQGLPARAPVRMGVAPTTLEEAWRMANYIAQSELVPKGYHKRPADVLVAIQYGMEVGLPPMQALHSIYVTNGRPNLYGDGFIAVIMASPAYLDHDEYYMVDGQRKEFLLGPDLTKDDTTAVTTFWRRDKPERPRTATFSIAKAKKAGLWTKQGPWQEYPDRMLKMRARGFAGHDAFPDVLRGIRMHEEVIDLPTEPEQLEPPKEVRRLSEQAKPGPVEQATNDGSIGTGPTHRAAESPANEVVIGPHFVKDVDQFLGGFTVTLADGTKVDTIDAADAMELEKFKGSKNKVRLVCAKADDGNLQLKSFGIAD